MTRSRRWVLAAGAALLAGGGAYWATSGKARIRAVLEQAFGPDIAREPDVAAFIADYISLQSTSGKAGLRWAALRHWLGLPGEPQAEASIVTAFARSTNAVRVAEAGEAFVYIGLESPFERPCRNPLSSHWL